MDNSTIIWIVVAVVVVLVIVAVIAFLANRNSSDDKPSRAGTQGRGQQVRGSAGSRGDEPRGQQIDTGQSRDRGTTSRPAGKSSDGPTRSRRGKRR